MAQAESTGHAGEAQGGQAAGMGMMALAMALLPVGDTLSKLLTDYAPALEVTMWRMLMQALVLIPLALVMRERLRGSIFSPLIAVSGLLTVTVLGSLITAFATMPIATAIAIFFVEPLLLTLLSGPLLGERAGPRRYAAVGVGLVGAMIVLRPSFAEFGVAALMPLLGALAYALNMIVVRKATRDRSVLTVQVGATLFGLGLLVIVVGGGTMLRGQTLQIPQAPATAWVLVLAAGALASVTFLLISEAFRRSEASMLAPFQYLEIVGATAMGYLVFGDFPDGLTWLGTGIILASGAYVFHRERKASAPQKARRRRTTR